MPPPYDHVVDFAIVDPGRLQFRRGGRKLLFPQALLQTVESLAKLNELRGFEMLGRRDDFLKSLHALIPQRQLYHDG
jgi:hypothetical protein